MERWCEHLPPTNVARVRFPESEGYSGFPLPSKTSISKFQLDQIRLDEAGMAQWCEHLPPTNVFIYLSIYLFIFRKLQI